MFFANELSNPNWQREMNLPLEFITFAYIEGKMYKHYRNDSTFILPNLSRWGNNVVYGGLFLLKDSTFYSRILDAYQVCSLSTLHKNHDLDIHHRVSVEATPISFTTLDDFARLKYTERDPIQAQTYLGNLKHPKINQRLYKTNISYRIIDGLDKTHFKQLIREVMP